MDYITRNFSLTNGTKEELKKYFLKTYDIYEKLFEILKDDSVFYEQPEKLRHPLIFYFGHTATFYINKLNIAGISDVRLDERMERIMAIGVDEMSWDDLNQNHYKWPSVDSVREYREKAKEFVLGIIDELEYKTPITWDNPLWIILMGIEHERIHLETSSVLIRQLDIKFTKHSSIFLPCIYAGNAPENELVDFEAAKFTLGKGASDGEFYGWDNEYGTKEAVVGAFKASKFLVSNGEFLEFVEHGGYSKDEFWESEGLSWKNYTKVTHPTFWVKNENGYKLRLINMEVALPLNFPVEVNYHEAKAFCNYKSQLDGVKYRMPSEDEWYAIYFAEGVPDEKNWGGKAPANINLEYFASPTPVDMFKFKNVYDAIGNVWQWSESTIDGYDGFRVHAAYDDFSIPTFDGRHNLIKGGSFISTGNEVLKESRYAFRRHFYQHAGFRYVVGEPLHSQNKDAIEKDFFAAQNCEFHYGKNSFCVDSAKYALSFAKKKDKALVVGCGVGSAVFEFAKEFEFVQGIDSTTRVIRIAEMLKNGESVKYDFDGVKNVSRETVKNVEFWQQDPCNLKDIFTGYDFIFVPYILDSLYNPKKFLSEIKSRINSDGVLVIGVSGKKINENELKDILKDEFGILDDGKIFDAEWINIENKAENIKYNMYVYCK